MNDILNKLKEINKTISVMESCTGGFIANAITNIPGASDVFSFAAVTYSNDFKIKIGVDEKLIEKYSVYSKEVAMEMSKVISNYANSDFGIGVTGKLNREDKNNMFGKNNTVYISIYDKSRDEFFTNELEVLYSDRCKNKEMVLNKIIEIMKEII